MMMTREWRTFSSTLGSSKRATMNWPRVISRGGVVFLMALTLAGCQSSSLPYASPLVVRTIEPSLTIPVDVQRIAVFYPRSSNSDFLEAYQRLEGATFQLKILRPTLKVVDRVHLLAVITEQHFQVTGAVADDGSDIYWESIVFCCIQSMGRHCGIAFSLVCPARCDRLP
jgi:hypothetical protein